MLAPKPSLLTASLLILVGFGLGVGLALGDHSAKDWLYSWGGAAEFAGLLLVAAPEVDPGLKFVRRVAADTGHRSIRVWEVAKVRLLGRPRPVIRYEVDLGGGVEVGGSVSTRYRPGGGVEDQLAYVFERLDELREADADLARRLEKQPDEWRSDIEAAEARGAENLEHAVADLQNERYSERAIGVIVVLAGVIVSTLGNLA